MSCSDYCTVQYRKAVERQIMHVLYVGDHVLYEYCTRGLSRTRTSTVYILDDAGWVPAEGCFRHMILSCS